MQALLPQVPLQAELLSAELLPVLALQVRQVLQELLRLLPVLTSSERPGNNFQPEWAQGSDNFAWCVRTGDKLVCTAEMGRDARYVLDKMYESAKTGEGWVRL